MTTTIVTLIPGTDVSKSPSLDGLAQAVVVDNYTNQWVYVPGAARFIPPWQYGVQLPLMTSAQNGAIKFDVPPGQLQVPTVAGQQCQAIFTSDPLAPSMGQAMPPLAQQQVLLGTMTGAASKSFNVPPGAYALQVTCTGSFGLNDTTSVEVIGTPSGAVSSIEPQAYLYTDISNGANTVAFPLLPSDSSVTVVISDAPAQTYSVYALMYAAFVSISPGPLPIAARIISDAGHPVVVGTSAGSGPLNIAGSDGSSIRGDGSNNMRVNIEAAGIGNLPVTVSNQITNVGNGGPVSIGSGNAADLITGISTSSKLAGWDFRVIGGNATAASSVHFQFVGEQHATTIDWWQLPTQNGSAVLGSQTCFPPGYANLVASLMTTETSYKVHVFNAASGVAVVAFAAVYFI